MSLKKPEEWRVTWGGPSESLVPMESDGWKHRRWAQRREKRSRWMWEVTQGSFEAELYHFLAQLCQLEHRSLTNLPRSTTHPATAFGSDGLL